MSGPILRALLLVLQASHRAFANADKSIIHEGWCVRPEDYTALNLALVRLGSRLPNKASDVSLTLRTEIALESLLARLEGGGQVHPDSALPSRTDFDTTEAQYGALASMRAPVRLAPAGEGTSAEYRRYTAWCSERGEKPMRPDTFENFAFSAVDLRSFFAGPGGSGGSNGR